MAPENIAILQRYYLVGGYKLVQQHLPDKNFNAIKSQAVRQGLVDRPILPLALAA